MIPQKTIIEKSVTGRQYLKERGLNPQMYFLSVDGTKVDMDRTIQQGQTVQAIPIVAGG